MKKLALLVLLAVFTMAGCVAQYKYDALFAESQKRSETIEKMKTQLDAQQKLADELKAKIDDMNSRGMSTSQELADIKKGKDALEAALKEKEEEISLLKSRQTDAMKGKDEELSALATKLASLQKEKDYLAREVDRLQTKTGELSEQKEKELAGLKNTYANLMKEMQGEIEKGDIKITQAVDRLSVKMVDKILFDSGQVDVKPAGLAVLKRVGDILKKITDKQIRVEGHTDNVPLSKKTKQKFPSNWELSTARATNVVRYMQDKVGLDPKRIFAAGFSEHRPVASNDTPEGKAQNRRIEIVLLPLDIDRVLEDLKK